MQSLITFFKPKFEECPMLAANVKALCRFGNRIPSVTSATLMN